MDQVQQTQRTTQDDSVQQRDNLTTVATQTQQQTEVIYTRMNSGHQDQQLSNGYGESNIQQIFISHALYNRFTSTETDPFSFSLAPIQTKLSGTNIIRFTSHVTEAESNFLRFCHLVQKIAPQAVRCRFDQQFPPDQLYAIIQRNMTLLMDLKDRRVLNKAQWKLIFPYGAKVTSTNFDVTLMVCFFRHLSSIAPQYCDFDTLPPSGDESLGADLARIKYYRNYIAHCLEKDRKLENFKFPICWETVSKAISRIGGQRYELECSNLHVANLDPSYMDMYRNHLVDGAAQQEQFDSLKLKIKDPLPANVRGLLK